MFGEPVLGAHDDVFQAGRHIFVQKRLFKIVKDGFAVQAVIGRGKTATRDRADGVDLIEQTMGLPLVLIAVVTQSFHDTVGKRRCTSAAARKAQQHHRIVWQRGHFFAHRITRLS